MTLAACSCITTPPLPCCQDLPRPHAPVRAESVYGTSPNQACCSVQGEARARLRGQQLRCSLVAGVGWSWCQVAALSSSDRLCSMRMRVCACAWLVRPVPLRLALALLLHLHPPPPPPPLLSLALLRVRSCNHLHPMQPTCRVAPRL